MVKLNQIARLVRTGPRLCLHFSGLGTMAIVICEKKVRDLKKSKIPEDRHLNFKISGIGTEIWKSRRNFEKKTRKIPSWKSQNFGEISNSTVFWSSGFFRIFDKFFGFGIFCRILGIQNFSGFRDFLNLGILIPGINAIYQEFLSLEFSPVSVNSNEYF